MGNLFLQGRVEECNVYTPAFHFDFLFYSILLVLSPVKYAFAEDSVYFDPQLMEAGAPDQKSIDLSIFSEKNNLTPGKYNTHIYLNQKEIFQRELTYNIDDNKKTQVFITPALLKDLGVKIESFPALANMQENKEFTSPGDYIPGASSTLNIGQMILNISIPQAALNRQSRDYIDPKFWDDGLPVTFSDYTYSGSKNQTEGDSEDNSTSHYLNLRNGANLGAWRLRNYSTWEKNDYRTNWNSIYTNIQRDIKFLKSQLTLGESYTLGDVFDSVKYNGVQLSSDDNMLPNSQRNYAPTVRGIANSNAEVTIKQNGYTIYQNYVPPGSFIIDDLYPTSSGGDLDVTIKEADGSERHFTQPYSAVPIMQRAGRLKYSLTGGRYRSNNSDDTTPIFVEATSIYGINDQLTVYGGSQLAENYTSGLIGGGFSFGDYGSLSFDTTYANSQLPDNSTHSGESYRLQYSKTFNSTDTSLALAGYRYSTKGFYTFEESNDDALSDNSQSDPLGYNKRSQMQIDISQIIMENISFYFSGYQRNYWKSNKTERTMSSGLNLSHSNINYNLSYTYSKFDNENDRQIALSVSIPLDKWLPHSWVTYNINRNENGDIRQQIGLSGTALEDNRMGYSVQQSYITGGNDSGDAQDTNLSLSYKSRYANLNSGYYYNKNNRQFNVGVSGAIVAHPHGITLAQPLGDSFALIDANGASDVHLLNESGVSTDWLGYAIIPYLTPYQQNRLALDTAALPDNVDSDNTSQTVIPNKGAMVFAKFDARVGHRILLTLKTDDGQFVPFGAMVNQYPETNKQSIVDENGVVCLTGVKENQSLLIKWGRSAIQQCKAEIELPTPLPEDTNILTLSSRCH